MKFGVVVFPGSNCDLDCLHVLTSVVGVTAEPIWHEDTSVAGYDCLILPGGFSYGDHLRAGAIARFSPVMRAVEQYARDGGVVLGICNGFQILVEAGLLPGALMRNDALEFRCEWVNLRVDNASTLFTRACEPGQILRMPVAHGDGRYHADEETIRELEARGGVVFRYVDSEGQATPSANPNGSVANIAGIISPEGNVLGLMPHPERAAEADLGGTDGLGIFESIVRSARLRSTTSVAGGISR